MNITVKQVTFLSADGKTTVYGWVYIPAGRPAGAVQIIHGMAEHMGRYHEFMRYLAQKGYAACGVDQLGHGRTGQGGPLGFFAPRDGWKFLIEDQHRFNKAVRGETGGCPVAVLGHSMGSFVARRYASKYQKDMDALMLSGTGRGGLRVDAAIQLADRSCRKNGPEFIDGLLDKLAFGGYNDRFKPVQTPYDWLSRDRTQVAAYLEDPECGFPFTAGGFRDLFALIRCANDKRCYESTPKDLPILLFSGDMDPVGDCGRGPRQVYERYCAAGVTGTELHLYTGGRHEMLNEVNRLQVWEDLCEWLACAGIGPAVHRD